jgi:hypothetical protein
MTKPLEVSGAKFTVSRDGVEIRHGWLFNGHITTAEAMRIRDWLNANYPNKPKECKCQPQ